MSLFAGFMAGPAAVSIETEAGATRLSATARPPSRGHQAVDESVSECGACSGDGKGEQGTVDVLCMSRTPRSGISKCACAVSSGRERRK